MKLTDKEFLTLAKYESNFTTIRDARWARNPGSSALDEIHAIYSRAHGTTTRLNKGCYNCIYSLLQKAGKLYFTEKEERIALENERKAVELSTKAARPRKKKVECSTI